MDRLLLSLLVQSLVHQVVDELLGSRNLLHLRLDLLLTLLLLTHQLGQEQCLLHLILLLSLLSLVGLLDFLKKHHGDLVKSLFQLLVLVLKIPELMTHGLVLGFLLQSAFVSGFAVLVKPMKILEYVTKTHAGFTY
jgi:hypothetical protein